MVEPLRASLAPGEPEELARWIELLFSAYRAKQPDPLRDMELALWLNLLGDWPEDVMRAAVLKWMSQDRPFPPSVPGELKALGDPIVGQRQRLLWRAERLCGVR